MIKLDNTFLEQVGLSALPEAEKKEMLKHIYEQLEYRVGTTLATGMTDAQLDEFERLISGDIAYAQQFLNTNRSDWLQSEAYRTAYTTAQTNAQKNGVQFNEGAVVGEFAALTWLEKNSPNYKQTVADELEKLKKEVATAAPQILAASQAAQQNPPQ